MVVSLRGLSDAKPEGAPHKPLAQIWALVPASWRGARMTSSKKYAAGFGAQFVYRNTFCGFSFPKPRRCPWWDRDLRVPGYGRIDV